MKQLWAKSKTPEGFSKPTHSTIGVKQEFPLSPTLFGLYVDEILEYIEKGNEKGAQLAGTWIPLLLYADENCANLRITRGDAKPLKYASYFRSG